MSPTLEIFIPGIAQPGGSKRGIPFKRNNGKVGVRVIEDCAKNKDWRAVVALSARRAMLEADQRIILKPRAIHMEVEFMRLRPRSHFGSGRNADILKPSAPQHHTVKPDTTKLVRALEDAMTGIIWEDDSQIAKQVASKRWGLSHGTMVRIWQLKETA